MNGKGWEAASFAPFAVAPVDSIFRHFVIFAIFVIFVGFVGFVIFAVSRRFFLDVVINVVFCEVVMNVGLLLLTSARAWACPPPTPTTLVVINERRLLRRVGCY